MNYLIGLRLYLLELVDISNKVIDIVPCTDDLIELYRTLIETINLVQNLLIENKGGN